MSRIAQGTLSADPNSVTASQTASIKGSSLQVPFFLYNFLFFISYSSYSLFEATCFLFINPNSSVTCSVLQCLVNVLKSLVDWEKLRGESKKHGNITKSPAEKAFAQESDELKNREDGPNQFQKAKAHKSTMEAAMSEVTKCLRLISVTIYYTLLFF